MINCKRINMEVYKCNYNTIHVWRCKILECRLKYEIKLIVVV
jgi:hypothetical protein